MPSDGFREAMQDPEVQALLRVSLHSLYKASMHYCTAGIRIWLVAS